MAACNFTIPFTGSANEIVDKARSAVESQDGFFEGDISSGSFKLSVFGNSIEGSYNIQQQDLNIIIDSKPFLVPCSVIEGFLKKQVI